MKRIDEKVKDLVEVRSHASLIDFEVDPLQTLVGYHFTDVTADMMAKWVGAVARVSSGNGASLALAGFRGVGKSHFLAAFGAFLSRPEFRSRVSEPHVSSAAAGLLRKSYAVAVLRRGTRPTLIAELKDAVAPVIGCDPSSLSDSLDEIMSAAASSAGECPLVLLIDTALERSVRVARDDGALLSEIGEISKAKGIFIGIALDDDIAGADGMNSAISRSFLIDYLDQEHLYRIVDNHIFPKNGRMQSVLHDIYDYYRTTVPGFRWSEERFRSLYPLHPAIMEIAPFVRLYMHEFALLGFASEAGSRILGRPANSLIAPDEVFDKVEKGLRKVETLQDAFAAFDKVNETVVARTPVMKRLQAKLILKGLFLFSLDDAGATASEIGASMLIFDEADPRSAVVNVESILAAFADAAPEQIRVQTEEGVDRRYAFRIDGKDDLKSALQAAAEKLPADVTFAVLKRQLEERFTDCDFQGSEHGSTANCGMIWRGGLRKGSVIWSLAEQPELKDAINLGVDWTAVVESSVQAAQRPATIGTLPAVSWCPAPLLADEELALKRYHVLMSDAQVRNDFQDHLSASIQSNAVIVEKITQRVMLDAGILSIEGFEYNFTEEARSAQSLAQVFTVMIESLFEGRFPMHPYFPQVIGMKEVSDLVADLFGNARPNLEETQRLASNLAQPLGIVAKPEAEFIPADGEELAKLPLVVEVLALLNSKGAEVSSLESVFSKLGSAPFGLVREASYLLLAAMVSARMLEFVTSNGDRINHRSLDLKLIWGDIVGIASPGEAGYSTERLATWAALITGNKSTVSLKTQSERESVTESLRVWQARWQERKIAAQFDDLNDELLNTRIWRLAKTATKAFVTVSDSVTAVLDKNIVLEDALQRIADAFSDSNAEFEKFSVELYIVEEFISKAKLVKEISDWVPLCEITGDEHIDQLRLELDDAVMNRTVPDARSNMDLRNSWDRFRTAYSGHFIERHDALLGMPLLKDKLNDIIKTDLWWEFENMSAISAFDPSFRAKATEMVQQIRSFDCRYDPKKLLESVPLCGCPYTLGQDDEIETLPNKLWRTANEGLRSFHNTIQDRAAELCEVLDQMASFELDGDDGGHISGLAAHIGSNKEMKRLSEPELRLLARAFDQLVFRIPKRPKSEYAALDVPNFEEASQEFDELLQAMPN
ncbi:MAG: ATP-binding protein [Acidobacteriota bacterium]